MPLWTTQQKEFYDELMQNGIAFCRQLSDLGRVVELAYSEEPVDVSEIYNCKIK